MTRLVWLVIALACLVAVAMLRLEAHPAPLVPQQLVAAAAPSIDDEMLPGVTRYRLARIEQRLDKMEANGTWQTGLLIGALVTLVLNLISQWWGKLAGRERRSSRDEEYFG